MASETDTNLSVLPESANTNGTAPHGDGIDSDPISVIHLRIDGLSSLRVGWDGYGAPTIDPEIIASAKVFVCKLIGNLTHLPLVVPMSNGSLQFEWHMGTRVLELEFETAQTIRYAQWDPSERTEHEDCFAVANVEKARQLINWFTSGPKQS